MATFQEQKGLPESQDSIHYFHYGHCRHHPTGQKHPAHHGDTGSPGQILNYLLESYVPNGLSPCGVPVTTGPWGRRQVGRWLSAKLQMWGSYMGR